MRPAGWDGLYIARNYDNTPNGKPIDWFEIAKYKDYLCGRPVLFIGNGPSAEKWHDYWTDETFVIAANGAIEWTKMWADMFLCTEATGHMLPWYYTPVRHGALRVVSGCNMSAAPDDQPAIAVERGWWCWGWKPRVYFDNDEHDRAGSLYQLRNSSWGYDYSSRKCWGLLKGPICYPGNMSIGTVLVNGLHLAAYMGATEINSVGFDLCMEKGHHWHEPKFRYGTSKWVRKECYMRVNGKPTIWHFALSAAYALDFVKPQLAAAGCYWEDHSDGLLQERGITQLMEFLYSVPADVEFA